jgi:oligopeptide transport system ATP-binding protein
MTAEPISTSPAPVPGTPTAAPGSPLLQVRDLKVWFPITEGLLFERHIGDVRAVDGVTFDLKRGETLGLVGESGCGKSTTGRAIVRLYTPTAGSILFDGQDISGVKGKDLQHLRRRFQMIFQDPYASLNPRMTAGNTVGEPLEVHSVGTKDERKDRIRDLFSTVGLNPDYANRYPHEFSGGQRQRIGVARALALDPDLIVADEPISALDVSIQAQVINLLEKLQERLGLTYLFIAHDLSVVRHISDRIAVMYLGRIVELAPSRELNTRPLHPYSVALLSAVPIPDPKVERRRRRIILRGDVPSPVNPPSGCHFHTRCWLRERLGNPERCSAEIPPLRTLSTGHEVACHYAEEVDGSKEQLQSTGRGGSDAAPAGGEAAAAAVPVSVTAAPAGDPAHDPDPGLEAAAAARATEDESLQVRSPYAAPAHAEAADLANLQLPVQPDMTEAPGHRDEA